MSPKALAALLVVALVSACGGGGARDGRFASTVAASFGGGTDSFGLGALAALPDGGAVAVGSLRGTWHLFEGSPRSVRLETEGSTDVLVVRLDAAGEILWVRSFGSGGADYAWDVAAFPDGSFVVAGTAGGEMSVGGLDPGARTVEVGSGGARGWCARFDADGSVRWVAVADTGGTSYSHAVVAHADGTSSWTGWYTEDLALGLAGEVLLGPVGSADVFVARLGTDGRSLWARRVGGEGRDAQPSLAPGPAGSVWLACEVEDEVLLGRSEPSETLIRSAGASDVLVAGFAADGALLLARAIGGPGYDGPEGFDVDAGGGCALSVSTPGGFDFGGRSLPPVPGRGRLILSLDAAGDPRGHVLLAGDEFAAPSSIAFLPDGDLVAGGYAEGRLAVSGPLVPPEEGSTLGEGDAFLARFSPRLELRALELLPGTTFESLDALAPAAGGALLALGVFLDDVTFGAGTPAEVTLHNVGNEATFFVRLEPPPR